MANAAFNRGGFETTFKKQLAVLGKSENITKETLRTVSRTVLEAHHATENIAYVNQLLVVLTPKNREMVTLFFKEFSGFKYNTETKTFSEKNKKKYDAAHALSMGQLEDPHFNVWSWAEKNIAAMEVKPKPQFLAMVEERVHSWVERAKKEKISHADLIVAFFKAGVDVDAITQAMEKLDVDVEFVEAPM